ncbi:2-succinyl-6-hydroxy-2,4-cyclohexadiene-1-carboxylate synthase [Staphylococcus equorum]|uniref:Putative 2-succinyl-6-hydroxy-2,4-cyclohexadiene-1-carboxylate synthase n=1 Tax=Staphylococcus equorum TaxID=246432 RepID=A0A9X4LDT7_9STAP|nr:2-succinyl-6-hydroxy-2,4-cyclohexadiene-1-carboxylate synthase [Staphylococcus equorum]MDG0843293.1 2-succinyl-6-hydroxy-2,4-cyclohexadiene-1-carboxylate synthase [Staphylococcus equorum]MDG0858820.1 2-succinyl-6-hydroxy-2,4-cyclohexadiene-1-carboxylate synthase [Staphylococcus equorum]
MLHYKFYRANQSTKHLLVMLHGFISDHQAFDNHIKIMKKNVNIVTIDLPGHGVDESPFDKEWDFPFINQQLDETLEVFKGYQLFLHGYSMGGRIALYHAIHGNTKLTGLVLESTSPGIEDKTAQIERQQVDNARAKVLEIAGLEVFVNDWEKLPLFYTQYDLDKATKVSIRNMRMRQNAPRLAKALRDYGTGKMPNLWSELSQIQIPTCIIVGTLDGKFCEIAQKMVSIIPQTELFEIAQSGHTVHVEVMAEFDRIVLGFIQKEEQND